MASRTVWAPWPADIRTKRLRSFSTSSSSIDSGLSLAPRASSSPERGTPISAACLAPARAAPSQSPSVGACFWKRSCQFWTPSGRSSRC